MYAKTLIPGPLPTPTLTATTSVAHQLFPELLASGWKRYGVEDLAVSRTDVLITHDSLQLVVDGIVVLSDIDPASPAGWWEAVDGIDGQCVVVVLKTGRSEAGARAATSHTAALASREAVWRGAFRQAGVVEVASGQELLDAAFER